MRPALGTVLRLRDPAGPALEHRLRTVLPRGKDRQRGLSEDHEDTARRQHQAEPLL